MINNISIHAEIGVLRNIKFVSKKIIKKMHLIVIRVTPDGKLASSKPCNNCIKYIRKLGILYISYSIDGGKIITEKVCEFHTDHLSEYHKSKLKK
jgi:hypothetical protein